MREYNVTFTIGINGRSTMALMLENDSVVEATLKVINKLNNMSDDPIYSMQNVFVENIERVHVVFG